MSGRSEQLFFSFTWFGWGGFVESLGVEVFPIEQRGKSSDLRHYCIVSFMEPSGLYGLVKAVKLKPNSLPLPQSKTPVPDFSHCLTKTLTETNK